MKTDPDKELPIWISETYSQPVSIGSVTMSAKEWHAAGLATIRRSEPMKCPGCGGPLSDANGASIGTLYGTLPDGSTWHLRCWEAH